MDLIITSDVGFRCRRAIAVLEHRSTIFANPTLPRLTTPTHMADHDPAFSSLAPTPSLAEHSDPLATGIKTLLDPSIRSTTEKLSEVYLAQQELGGELERLVSRALSCQQIFPARQSS